MNITANAVRVAWADTIGFLDSGDPPGAVTFTVNVPQGGIFRMHVYHTTPWGAASHYWQINDGEPLVFQYPERDWDLSEFPYEIELNERLNTIRVSFRGGITKLRRVELQRYIGNPPPDYEKPETPEPPSVEAAEAENTDPSGNNTILYVIDLFGN